jgi:hypothetical protein
MTNARPSLQKNQMVFRSATVFLTEQEMARRLKIHQETLAKLRRDGKAPAEYVQIGKSIRYVIQP